MWLTCGEKILSRVECDLIRIELRWWNVSRGDTDVFDWRNVYHAVRSHDFVQSQQTHECFPPRNKKIREVPLMKKTLLYPTQANTLIPVNIARHGLQTETAARRFCDDKTLVSSTKVSRQIAHGD